MGVRAEERGEMSERRRFDATRAAGALRTEHCDIPLGMTLGEWRTACAARDRAEAPPRRSLLRGLRSALRIR